MRGERLIRGAVSGAAEGHVVDRVGWHGLQ